MVDDTQVVKLKTTLFTQRMADVAGIEEEQGVEVIDDGVLNGQYLLGRNGPGARPSTSRARDGRLHPQRPGRHGRVRGRRLTPSPRSFPV